MNDGLIPEDPLPVRLPVFEGPLDLLLYLVRRNEVDIYDIPIEQVTRQYIAALKRMERLDLDIAGDFFVMAATLMYLKSRMLVPRSRQAGEDEDDGALDDETDPRWELVQQLIEYRRLKESAATLDELIRRQNELLPRDGGQPQPMLAERPLAPVDRMDLWALFNQVLRSFAERQFEGTIHEELVSVSGQMEVILRLLESQPQVHLADFLESSRSARVLIPSFLAILELARLGKIAITQHHEFGDIQIVRPQPSSSTVPA